MGCLLSDCLFSLTESSLWQLRAVLRPDPSVCLFFLPGPRDSLLSYLCPTSVCQRLLTQFSAVCVGGLSPLTTPWSFISLSDALTLFLFSFIPHESLHQSSPLIFWFRASSSLPAYGLNGPINTAHAFIQNDTFVWVWMTSQKVKAEIQEMEATAVVCPVCPSVLLPLAPRAVRSQGKRSCCFGSPLGAFCPDSAPSRDIPERSCWRREGRAGCSGHLSSFTTLSGLMLVCIHNFGPGGEGAIQKWNGNYSLIKLKTAPVSPSWQIAQHNINLRLFLNDHFSWTVGVCMQPSRNKTNREVESMMALLQWMHRWYVFNVTAVTFDSRSPL